MTIIDKIFQIYKGEKWKARRRLLTPAFHFKILESALHVFNEKSLECANQLDKIISKNNFREIDVYSLMTEVTLDIVCGIIVILTPITARI